VTSAADVPHLDDDDVLGSTDMAGMTDELELAFADLGVGTAATARRVRAHFGGGDASAMSAFHARRGVGGGKVYLNNPGVGRGFMVVLFREDGSLLGTVSGTKLTAERTGATTALGIRHLARSGATRAAMFGTGEQARWQLLALDQELDLDEVRVVGRNPERVDELVAWARESGLPAVASSAENAVRDAQVVVTVTATVEPLFDGRWLADGALVVGVGSTKVHRQELDVETVRRASLVVSDAADSARDEAGDLVHAADAGAFDWDSLVGLEQVVAADGPRPADHGITLFESQGLALEDVAGAWQVLHRLGHS
jgi:ornithine cyclodeaminase/alanine dehydrogenase-like protein (mu-crystallin family)